MCCCQCETGWGPRHQSSIASAACMHAVQLAHLALSPARASLSHSLTHSLTHSLIPPTALTHTFSHPPTDQVPRHQEGLPRQQGHHPADQVLKPRLSVQGKAEGVHCWHCQRSLRVTTAGECMCVCSSLVCNCVHDCPCRQACSLSVPFGRTYPQATDTLLP
jgi:hypothetical protein